MMLKQTSSIIVSALLAFGATQACSSDESGTPFPSAGAGGATAGAGGALTGGGGSTAAGTGGSTAATGGGVAGSGGAAAGTGGAAAGSGGTGGGSAGSGGAPAATFTAVKAIFGAHCGVGACHSPDSGAHLNYQSDPKGLYAVLTTAIPDTVPFCKGRKVVDGANGLLLKVVAGPVKCDDNPMPVPRMPEGCVPGNEQRPCLTDAQIKTISDWIAAGAKND